jgi:hypothetical protein
LFAPVIRFDTNFADFLYAEGDTLFMMNPETFEQYELPSSTLGSASAYLAEGMRISLFVHDGTIMRAEMPAQVVMEVVEAEQRSKDSKVCVHLNFKNITKFCRFFSIFQFFKIWIFSFLDNRTGCVQEGHAQQRSRYHRAGSRHRRSEGAGQAAD